MAAIRIVSDTADGAFPYDAALRELQQVPGVAQDETDIPAIIDAGKRVGWPQELIEKHFSLLERGRRFDFNVDDGISCTLWEDNIFFRFFDAAHERRCIPTIEDLALRLGCRVILQ